MRYLKLQRGERIYDYIPLESASFRFIKVDENEYQVEICVGSYSEALFEKLCIDADAFMQKLVSIKSDCKIITVGDLL